jgi:hypothetical protein
LMPPAPSAWKMLYVPTGTPATIPAKMISEMPLPMPFSLIFSPSHIRNVEPAVSDTMMLRYVNRLGLVSTPQLLARVVTPMPWMTARTTVPQRV